MMKWLWPTMEWVLALGAIAVLVLLVVVAW